jgi:hypothetical protein
MTGDFNNIKANDVLCGRGGATNNHPGNISYRKLVADYQTEYLEARKKAKAVIARRIVAAIMESGGRFLKHNEQSDVWVEVPIKKATEKTSQALREGLDVRHKVLRPEKTGRPSSDSLSENPRKRAKIVEGAVVKYDSAQSPSVGSAESEGIPDLDHEDPHMSLYLPLPLVNQSEMTEV